MVSLHVNSPPAFTVPLGNPFYGSIGADVTVASLTVSASLLAGDPPQAQKGMRVPAGDIEALVLDRLRAFFSSRIEVSDALTPLDLEARAFDAALRNACTLSKRWLAAPLVEMKSLVRDIVEQITVAADRIEVRLSQAKIAAAESE